MKLALFAAACVAAVLVRLPTPDGYGHYYPPEQARELAAVRRIAAGDLPLVGPTQFMDSRYHFGAVYWYLLVPLTALGGFADWSVPLTSGLFSLLAIALGMRLVRRWFRDGRFALTYGAAAAFSSLDIQYAKYASTPNLVPLVTLAYLVALTEFVEGCGTPWLAGAVGFLIAVAAQLHPVAGASLALIALTLAALRRFRPGWRGWLMLAGAAAIMYLPYLQYEFSHGFANTGGLLSLLGGQREFGSHWTRILENAAFWFSLWFNVHHLFGLPNLLGMVSFWFFAATVLVLAGIWLAESRHPTEKIIPLQLAPAARTMLLVWLVVPTAILTIPMGRISQLPIYYFAVLLPLGHLAVALGFRRLLELGFRRTAIAAMIAFFSWQAVQIGVYEHFYPSVLTVWLLK